MIILLKMNIINPINLNILITDFITVNLSNVGKSFFLRLKRGDEFVSD